MCVALQQSGDHLAQGHDTQSNTGKQGDKEIAIGLFPSRGQAFFAQGAQQAQIHPFDGLEHSVLFDVRVEAERADAMGIWLRRDSTGGQSRSAEQLPLLLLQYRGRRHVALAIKFFMPF